MSDDAQRGSSPSIPSSTFVWGQEGDDCPLLSKLTTLEVGGRPRYYALVHHEHEACEVARWSQTHGFPLWILGGGSNVVCDDHELDGVVLQLGLQEMTWHQIDANQSPGTVDVTLGAGVIWNDFVDEAVKRNLAGVECLVGIPGWVGAAPIQNIGAYGQELSDTCVAVRVYDRIQDEVKWWSVSECQFAYRHSVFKENMGRYLILAIRLRLNAHGKATLRYPQLQNYLAQYHTSDEPTLINVAHAVRALRASKSMLWRIDDPNRRSVGSFFLNPIITDAHAAQVKTRSHELGLASPPLWPVHQPNLGTRLESEAKGQTHFKLPAAWLIERSGFAKGSGEGQVGISSAHTLAIINRGGAYAQDVIDFARQVQRQVWRTWGIWLTPEARLINSAQEVDPLRFRPRIALVSCRDLPTFEVDDHPLWEVLRARGVELELPVWDDPQFDWENCDLVIPRTTWDYQERWTEFLLWMQHVSQVTELLNPLELMSWNLDKRYLKEIEIGQPPTRWIDQRTFKMRSEVEEVAQSILDSCREEGWAQAFLKPNIGASAVGSMRFSVHLPEDYSRLVEHLECWLPLRTMILQPYINKVESIGEHSLIYFNGVWSHGVRKVPAPGDYRVQDDYGASDMPWDPPDEWKDQCEALIKRLPMVPLYARCDFLSGPRGEPWLVELELIEPSLFFRHDASSPQRFADAILARCPDPARPKSIRDE